MMRSTWRLAALTALACGGLGCSPQGDHIVNQVVDDDMPASGSIVAVTTSNILFHVNPARPDRVLHSVPVVGLDADDSVLSLDYRPADGQLYAWTLQRRLYLVNPATGAALRVGNQSPPLAGTFHEMDFNPVIDRARVVTEVDGNIRVNPNDGSGITDTNLAFAAGDPNAGTTLSVIAIAYTNNVANAASTTLYGIDSFHDVLVTLPSPNAGLATTIGPLVTPSSGASAMDIAPDGTAYAAVSDNLVMGLCTVNLTTGVATRVGTLGTGTNIAGMTVAP